MQAIDRKGHVSAAQEAEVVEIINTIHTCDEGQKQLQQIYSKVDQTSDGHGAVHKHNIWEDDVSDMEQFRNGQETNGMYV